MKRQQGEPKTSLADLLRHLDERAAEGLARIRLDGHAVSKSKDSLHLAIPSGLVAVPFSEIEDVFPIFEAPTQEWVSVVVRNADRVQYLWRAGELMSPDTQGGVALMARATVRCFDTTTKTSREGADATDDGICFEQDDTPRLPPGGSI
jgi:hypothetical protein